MKIVGINNDINFVWKFYTNDGGAVVPYIIDNIPVKAIITNQYGTEIVEKVESSENEATFSFAGKQQKNIGVYTITIEFYPGTKSSKTIVKNAVFKLISKLEKYIVDCCNLNNNEESVITIEISSEIDPIIPPSDDCVHEAPNDGYAYVRKSLSWEKIEESTSEDIDNLFK